MTSYTKCLNTSTALTTILSVVSIHTLAALFKRDACVIAACTLLVLPCLVKAGNANSFGTAFAYQGQLTQDGLPLNGTVDLDFSLHADAVTLDQIGMDYRLDSVSVANGTFSVQIDFGIDAFPGTARWLEVRVRIPHDVTDTAPFITLDPRQEISPTPYTIHAGIATFAHTAEVANAALRPFRVDGDDAVFDGGNVGVNTSQPLGRLHLVDTSLGLTSAAIREEALIIEDSNAVLGLFSARGPAVGSVISLKEMNNGSMTDNWTLWRASSAAVGGSALHFSYGTQPAGPSNPRMMTIMPTGNVGVGVTAPQAKLEVAGDVLANRFTAGNPGIDGSLHIFDDSGNVAIRLDSDNFSAAPQFAMYGINGTSETVEIVARESDGAARIMLRTEAGDNMIEIDALESDGAAIKLLDPATDTVSVAIKSNNGGRVGIGTSNPAGQLHVAGGGGNQSVILPANAIASGEILNEAGIAFKRETLLAFDTGSGWVPIALHTITYPSSGFILAIGTTELINRTIGAPTVTLGLSRFVTPGPAAQYNVTVPGAGAKATGTVQSVLTVTGAGSTTVVFLAQTNGSVFAENPAITLLFIPTAYGEVDQ